MKLKHLLFEEDKINVDDLIKKGFVTVTDEPNPETGKIETRVYNAPQLKKYISQLSEIKNAIKILNKSSDKSISSFANTAYKQLNVTIKSIRELEAQIAASKQI